MHYPYQIKSLSDYHIQYQKSVEQPEEFWSEVANNFTWKKKWDKVLTWDFKTPSIKWFEGATLNVTENCLDRHLSTQPECASNHLGVE
jgi:acetyl-CoA synthetase